MLNRASVVTGVNLAKVLTENGFKLVPKNMTLLTELNNAINNNMMSSLGTSEDFIIPAIVGASTGYEETAGNQKGYVSSPHDTFMDNYIADLERLVTGYVSFARSVVNKKVTSFKQTLDENIARFKYREPEEFFKITYFKLLGIYDSLLVTNEIKSYTESSGTKFFYEQMTLAQLTAGEFDITKYLLVGDEEQDRYIVELINNVGPERAVGFLINNVSEYSMSTDELLDYAMVNYLFYRNLAAKGDLDLGYSATVLRTKASTNRDYFGHKLSVALDMYHRDIRNGRILSTTSDLAFSYLNSSPLNITIYEESFKKLAEAGCSIECIFGYISGGADNNNVTVEQMVAGKELYLSKWMNTRSLYLIQLNNSRLDVFKQILRETFESSLNETEFDADEQEFLNSNSGFMEETRKIGNEYIDQLHVSDIDDVDKIALELVAKIRYRFTNAYFILKEMSEIMKMSDKMEPLEAALYAVIKYVTDFLMSQLDVVRT